MGGREEAKGWGDIQWRIKTGGKYHTREKSGEDFQI